MAQALYARNSADAITRNEAGESLTVACRGIEELVDQASQQLHKSIIFATGVPGAGKTLVGLNIATGKRAREHGSFPVGNLVCVKRWSKYGRV